MVPFANIYLDVIYIDLTKEKVFFMIFVEKTNWMWVCESWMDCNVAEQLTP